MRRFITTVLIAVSIITMIFAGCSSVNSLQEDTTSKPMQESSSNMSLGKTLIAYYSYSGTTKRVAEHLQAVTGGDLYELTLKESYSGSDNDVSDRVFLERGKGKMPELSGELPDVSV